MKQKKCKCILMFVATLLLLVPCFLTARAATTVTVLNGQITLKDEKDKIQESNDVVTIKATGGAVFGSSTNTVTLTNSSGSLAKIEFSVGASNYYSYSVNGVSKATSFSGTVAAGGTIEIKLTARGNLTSSKTATMTLSDFKCSPVSSSYEVTVDAIGNGSVELNQNSVTFGEAYSISALDGATLVATPSNGYEFVGWKDTGNGLLSKETSFSIKPTSATTVYAVFAKCDSEAWFWVDEKYLTNDLNYASTTLGTTIVLAANGTLSSGNYTIQSGDTLLIPFDTANTLYTNKPGSNGYNVYTAPSIYRCLTMANGTHITVNGAISLSAKHSSKMPYNGAPSGPCSRINMQQGSSITVEGGGALYAWGFITGQGAVTVKNKGVVYECFQVRDYRGGDVTSQMVDSGKTNLSSGHDIFPMSQYYIQNVEVPMTLEYGSAEYGYMSVGINALITQLEESATVPIIGEGGLFQLAEGGSIVKDYIESEDRLKIVIDGSMTFGSFSFTIKISAMGSGVTIDSAKYKMPLNGNISILIKSGSTVTVNQNMVLLPGSSAEIEENATLDVGSGKSIVLYDSEQWDNYCYNRSKFVAVAYAPGRQYTRSASDLFDVKILVNGCLNAVNGGIYTTEGGANICSSDSGVVKIGGFGNITVSQVKQEGDDNKTLEFVKITVARAKLKNANTDYEPYVTTAGRGTTAITYGYANGRWYSLAVNPTNANTDQTNISAKFRVEDYLWMNGSCYFGKVDAESVWADIATTNISVQTFNTTTKSWEDVTGYVDAVVINGEVYLVKKVLSDEIPKNITFRLVYTIKDGESITAQYLSVPITVNFMTYADAYIEANKNASADAVREDGVKVLDMVDLLKAMKTYGDAAEIYFDKDLKAAYNKDESKVVPDEITMTEAKDTAMSLTNGAESGVTGASLKTNSAKVYFDEALRMSVFFTPTGFDESKIVKIGLLASPGVLNDTGVLTAANHQTMYVLYSLTSPEIPGGSENYPDEDLKENVNNTVTSYNTLPAKNDSGRWELCFDLTNEMYNEVYELRPFVIVEDETGTYYVYGEQVHYSLAAYISRTYAKSTDKAFKNLLTATWDYIVAADAAFCGEQV